MRLAANSTCVLPLRSSSSPCRTTCSNVIVRVTSAGQQVVLAHVPARMLGPVQQTAAYAAAKGAAVTRLRCTAATPFAAAAAAVSMIASGFRQPVLQCIWCTIDIPSGHRIHAPVHAVASVIIAATAAATTDCVISYGFLPTFSASHTYKSPCALNPAPRGLPGPRYALGLGFMLYAPFGCSVASNTAPYLSNMVATPEGDTMTDSAAINGTNAQCGAFST